MDALLSRAPLGDAALSTFVPARWLPGPHLQTVWGPLVRPRDRCVFRRETLPTPDGDELLLDQADPMPGAVRGRVILLHGLEGSSRSVYIQGLASLLLARGFAVTALNFRSCARDPADPERWIPNRAARLYHSGETSDLDHVVRVVGDRETGPIAAIGVSLGGNVLLKWLGEDSSRTRLFAAATISVPYDLGAGSRHLEGRIGRLYIRNFVRTLSEKGVAKRREFPEAARIDLASLRRARTFRELDDAATAPLHGFTGADDYYARSSSIRYAGGIRTPVLAISSEDDPFLPADVLPRLRMAASSAVRLVVTKTGGHAGFVSGAAPGRARYWAEETIVRWIESRLEPNGAPNVN